MARKIGWQKDLEQGLEEFGWREVGVEGLGRMSLMKIGHMMRDSALRKVKKGWEADAQERSKQVQISSNAYPQRKILFVSGGLDV